MSDAGSVADPVGQLAEEFMARYRRGERPALSEYTDKYPELAGRIRDVFPMLVVMEEADSGSASSGEATGAGPTGALGREGGPLTRIAGYRILREVGRGGMGVVYEAEQLALGRHVALKVLPEPIARDPRGLERFRREARAAARLHHTNIVPVHEVSQDGGVVFYAMQFIQGQPLDVVLDELKALRQPPGAPRSPDAPTPEADGAAAEVARSLLTGRFGVGPADEPDRDPDVPATVPVPLDPGISSASAVLPGQSEHSAAAPRQRHYHRSVAQVGVQVAEALAYAHREGVIHRDIKPSNLLLDAESRVWVTDFGLAKTEGDALTHTGDILGTLRYMAPERFRGWSDPRSDVYSLGLTLYEMLLLRPAFESADRLELIRRVTHEEPTRPRKLDPRIARDLETIVLKAIDKEPSRRYPSSDELAADLRRFLEGEPIKARSVGPMERTLIWSRRRPAIAGLLVLVALSSATGLAGVLWHWNQAIAARELAEQRRNEAQAETRKAFLRLTHLNYERGQAACEKGEIGPGMLWTIESWRAAARAGDVDWQNAARANLAAWQGQYPRLVGIISHANAVWSVAFSPDGKSVLTGSTDGTAQLWDAETGLPHGSPMRNQAGFCIVAFSRVGETFVTGWVDGTAQLWDAHTGEPKGAPLSHGRSVKAAAFSPNGKILLTGCGDGTAWFWDVATGQSEGPRLWHQGLIHSVAFSPDGTTILTGSADKSARFWNASNGQPVGELPPHGDTVWSVAFSPDGTTALTGSIDGEVRVWPMATLPDDLERAATWVEALTGLTIDDTGSIQSLDRDAWLERREEVERQGGPPVGWPRQGESPIVPL